MPLNFALWHLTPWGARSLRGNDHGPLHESLGDVAGALRLCANRRISQDDRIMTVRAVIAAVGIAACRIC